MLLEATPDAGLVRVVMVVRTLLQRTVSGYQHAAANRGSQPTARSNEIKCSAACLFARVAWLQYLKAVPERLIHAQDRTRILIHIIWRREQTNEPTAKKKNSYPPPIIQLARHTKSKSNDWQKFETISAPNESGVQETSGCPQPSLSSSSSFHNKSHRMPDSGISMGRSILLICSIEVCSGESPPCTQKILSLTTAAIGNQLNTSQNVLHRRGLYFARHSS
mmetsp:Transcript_8684/g.18511  ORF Transcript_8684/g.18511 Transcript_8684/m.18511 type:complete len:221 (-) Transcript_8684:454-1116(-)